MSSVPAATGSTFASRTGIRIRKTQTLCLSCEGAAWCREHAKVKPQDLSNEIEQVLASKQLPTYIANDIDAIRHIGNFAAHPIKSTNSGEVVEVVDVEDGEAEWTLDTIVQLFDHYFVGPAEAQKKRDALNAELADAKKPPMKQP